MMRSSRSVFSCAAVLVAFVACALSASAAKIVVEAENYNSITPSMAKASSNVASGGAYIHIPLLRPHGDTEGKPSDTGNTVYKVKVTQAGTYTFWGRAQWYDGCGNSFFLKIDDKPAVVFGNGGTYRQWHWVKGIKVTLTAGVHTIRIQNREDGAKLDQFVLETTPRVPVGLETPTPGAIVR